MPKSSLNVTRRPPRASAQYKAVRNEVRKGLKRTGERTVKAFERVVANWRTRPKFKAKVGSGTKQLFLRIEATGTKQARLQWKLIDKTGRRKQTIYPKRGKYLVFRWGGYGSYDSKTKGNPARFGGSGKVRGGKVVFLKKVKHPGFKPRDFSGAILRDVIPEMDKEVRNGYRRGLRRAKAAGLR